MYDFIECVHSEGLSVNMSVRQPFASRPKVLGYTVLKIQDVDKIFAHLCLSKILTLKFYIGLRESLVV